MTTGISGDFVVEAKDPRSRWELAAICAGLTAVCVALVIWGGLVGLVCGLPGAVFFGAICLPYIVLRAIHPVPVLTIGPDGFTVRQYATDAGFVSWDEVHSIETGSRGAFSWIIVTLRDPMAFLKRHGRSRRALLRVNSDLRRGRVRIAGVQLSQPVGDVVQIMEARRNAVPGD